jgi:hypothetical protein
MDERTEGQLRVIRKVISVMQAAHISAWLFGGWGLDAREAGRRGEGRRPHRSDLSDLLLSFAGSGCGLGRGASQRLHSAGDSAVGQACR